MKQIFATLLLAFVPGVFGETLSWNPVQMPADTQGTVGYKVFSFATAEPANVSEVGVTDTSYVLTGLVAGQEYEVFVRSSCINCTPTWNDSMDSNHVRFTATPAPEVIFMMLSPATLRIER